MSTLLLEKILPTWLEEATRDEGAFSKIPEETIQEMYALAYAFYQKADYNQASLFFRLLVTVRPFEIKFWKGFGASLQMEKHYGEALNCYMTCVNLSETQDPYIYLHAADCFFALKDVELGLNVLEEAKLAAQETNDVRVLKHVHFMHQQWVKQ